MKKLVISAALLAAALSAKAQQKADSVLLSQLNDKIRKLEVQRKNDSAKINGLEQTISQQNNNLQYVDTRVKEFRTRMEITDKDRYEIISKNLLNSVELFDMLNQKLSVLEALNQLDKYQSLLTDLNNPANESLGFSYNKKVMAALEQNIANNTGKDKGRILEAAKVLMQTPAIQGLTAPIAPVMNIGNALLGFASNLYVNRKDINQDNLVKFKSDLDRFTQYYARLNEINATFSNNVNNYKLQSANLQMKLKDFVVKNLQESGVKLDPNLEKSSRTTSEYISRLFGIYNANEVRVYLSNLEKAATEGNAVNHNKLLKTGNLVNMNKRVDEVIFLYKEFESLYTQYISMLDKNNQQMVQVLQDAINNKLSDDEAKVKEQIAKINSEKQRAIDAIDIAINISRMKPIVERLDTFYPSL